MNAIRPLVSVVIPAFNEEKLLPICLRHVREACEACGEFSGRYEIIVCDNNSTDQTATVAGQFGGKVVFEPINQISRARNRGGKYRDGRVAAVH